MSLDKIYKYNGIIYNGNAATPITEDEICKELYDSFNSILSPFIKDPVERCKAAKICTMRHIKGITTQIPDSYKETHRIWDRVFNKVMWLDHDNPANHP